MYHLAVILTNSFFQREKKFGFSSILNFPVIVKLNFFYFLLNTFRYRDEFDVILIDEASTLTELETLPAFAFSPKSIVLFGDAKQYPGDQYKLRENYDKKMLTNFFYRTIFHYFLKNGRDRVLRSVNQTN